VVDPMMTGLAGFGSGQIYLPGKAVHEFIDFHGKTPAAARPDMWADLIEGETRDGFGFVLKGRVNMYNGAMGVFDPRPGHAGSVAPGKSRFSAICPTLVFGGDRLRAALGAPGGAQIAIGVMQALVNLLEFGMSMSDAVAAPRFSATSHIIDVTMRIPTYVTDELTRDGYTVARNPNTFDFAAVHGIEVRGDGTLHGGADPGHDGMALAV
jgi:gamma-glutamyltranspeptidase/glutathione hydrolase